MYILLPFLSVALHESGTRNALLGPRPPLSVLKITQLQDKQEKGDLLIQVTA